MADFEKYLHRLPRTEAYCLEQDMKGRKQTDIAKDVGVSQPTVSYKIRVARKRIDFMIQRDKLDFESFQTWLQSSMLDSLDIQIILLMWETTCQSEVARRLNRSQGCIRYRFLRAIEQIKKQCPVEGFAEILVELANNPNILWEIVSPKKGGLRLPS